MNKMKKFNFNFHARRGRRKRCGHTPLMYLEAMYWASTYEIIKKFSGTSD